MATAITQPVDEHIREEKKTAEVLFGGVTGEVLLAAGAVVLTIIALTGRMPEILLAVGVIALGAALVFESAAISLRIYNLLNETAKSRFGMAELGIGTTVESITGIAAIVLGVLAIFRLHPMVLIPAAIIVIGACLILEAGANARINALRVEKPEEHPYLEEITRQSVWATTEIQAIVGIGGVTLGILSLCGVFPMTLNLIAVLGMSAAAFLSGTALSGRMLKVFES